MKPELINADRQERLQKIRQQRQGGYGSALVASLTGLGWSKTSWSFAKKGAGPKGKLP